MLCNVFLNMGMHKLDFGGTLVCEVNMAARRVPPRHTMNRGAMFLSMVCYKCITSCKFLLPAYGIAYGIVYCLPQCRDRRKDGLQSI